MTNQKMTSKRQNVIIAILSVLLVGLLAFNVTYAFFTDKENNADKFTFGTISLATTGAENTVIQVTRNSGGDPLSKTAGVILPGDKITGTFKLDLKEDSEDAFVRFKLNATAEYGYLYEDSTIKAGAVAEGAIIAYINGEIVQAVINAEGDDATIYANGAAVANPSQTLVDAVLDYEYIASYTLNNVEHSIAFQFDNVNNAVKATIDNTEYAATAPQVQAYLEQSNADLARKADIDAAVADLNDAFQTANANANLTTGTKYTTANYSRLGDGYIYRNAALTAANDLEVVDFVYTLPLTDLGNALQGVTINFDLLVEAVQAANVDAADVDLTGVDGVTEDNRNAVTMFYAVTSSNANPVPANYSDN